jgi:hypothetical protein
MFSHYFLLIFSFYVCFDLFRYARIKIELSYFRTTCIITFYLFSMAAPELNQAHNQERQQESGLYDIYLIHDNGGCPFEVSIDEDAKRAIVKLYDYDSSYETDITEDPYPILDIHFKECFLGGPLPETFKNDNYDFEWGNSILLHISSDINNTQKGVEVHKYISIGMNIFEFTSPYPIIEFIAPIGNNDVPYPFARSEKETYLLIEDVILDNTLLEEEGKIYPDIAHCPYRLYYKHGNVIFNNERLPIIRKINPRIIQARI